MQLHVFLRAGLILFILIALYYINTTYLNLEAEELQNFLLSFGILAPVIFILLFSIRPFLLFPSSVLAIAGGLAFGPFIGPLVTYIGSLAGGILSFLFIRKVRKKKTEGEGTKRELIKKRIEENGLFYIVSLRIIPVINFDLVSYLAALSTVRFKTYAAATMIGIIPGTIAFNLLGASLADLSPGLIAVTALMFAIALSIPVYVRHLLRKRNLDIEDITDKK
ncbi:TVP38/TMEM64 family protein [Alkalicoccus daliensis]|uniref:TVP38/TMEM64 family membrane protein n=1 Tax=Alkalicoccus daliensis TaxID=745820 RepID=A0A1H0AM12_9BACI|nr:TVP38/TMEM64 family protein [Alkalicoccus daliensis]SDN34439.1 Uncharacterized membrane protein YdjX, TVP38/TMEM64 family, SNARE-associated domain [Alkalicoccus daliensis]